METILCGTAQEFLRYLDPADSQWNQWIFRGQPDVEDELLPLVWRSEGKIKQLFDGFTKKINKDEFSDALIASLKRQYDINGLNMRHIVDWAIHARFENYLLSNFYAVANEAGLELSDHYPCLI